MGGVKIYFFWWIFLFCSCSLWNQDEPIAAYLQIGSIDLRTTVAQGSASHRITDVWVFRETEFLGMFPLPARIPLLLEGEQNLSFQAGVKENGIGATPVNYPFFSPMDRRVILRKMQSDTLNLATTYVAGTRFHFQEHFEANTSIFSSIVSGLPENRVLPYAGPEVVEGKYAGRLQFTRTAGPVIVRTSMKFRNTFQAGQPVFLELDYRSEAPCMVGIQFFETENPEDPGLVVPVAGFRESAGWKRIYFNLGSALGARRSAFYSVVLQPALPEGKDGAVVLLDNIRLLSL